MVKFALLWRQIPLTELFCEPFKNIHSPNIHIKISKIVYWLIKLVRHCSSHTSIIIHIIDAQAKLNQGNWCQGFLYSLIDHLCLSHIKTHKLLDLFFLYFPFDKLLIQLSMTPRAITSSLCFISCNFQSIVYSISKQNFCFKHSAQKALLYTILKINCSLFTNGKMCFLW